jgi:DNA-binding transcriptional MerR regulator/methylmalonyl-CoA mutase cobalamin-binding subunit
MRPETPGLTIAAVERDTGIGKDALRVWERRYGFPSPGRDAHGERIYPAEQVETLRLVKRLLDAGHRPGRLLKLPPEEIRALADAQAATQALAASGGAPPESLAPFVETILRHDAPALRHELGRMLARLGAGRFVTELVAPLNVAVGEAWMSGRMEVYEEHSYSEEVQVVMRQAIAQMPEPPASSRPRVLLSTFPGEPHGLGLLMAETLLRLESCPCVSLGVQTPVLDIVRAAEAHQADIVAIGLSSALGPQQVIDALSDLRGLLPPGLELWAGGSAPVLQRRPVAGVRVLRQLHDIAPAVRAWRETRASP